MTIKELSDKFDSFIYEEFADNYGGTKEMFCESYEEYRQEMDEDEWLTLGARFTLKKNKQLLEVLRDTKAYIENNEGKLEETQELTELCASISEVLN